MTTLRNSQLAGVTVNGGVAANLRASQFAAVAVAANPAAAGMRVSQFMVVAVISNGKSFQPLGPVIKLGCWTPCANLIHNPNGGLI